MFCYWTQRSALELGKMLSRREECPSDALGTRLCDDSSEVILGTVGKAVRESSWLAALSQILLSALWWHFSSLLATLDSLEKDLPALECLEVVVFGRGGLELRYRRGALCVLSPSANVRSSRLPTTWGGTSVCNRPQAALEQRAPLQIKREKCVLVSS